MICEKCGNEMRITRSATRPVIEDGVLTVVHVNVLRCRDPACPEHGRDVECLTVMWEGDRETLEPLAREGEQ